MGKRVYDPRHTCLTAWLNHGIPPAQIAECVGNGVPVLLAEFQQRIEGPWRLPVGPAPGMPVLEPGSTPAPRRRACPGRRDAQTSAPGAVVQSAMSTPYPRARASRPWS